MARRFNPAPGWPSAPDGWLPPAGWQPEAGWPPAPAGWQLIVDDEASAVTPVLGPPPAGGAPRAWYKKKRFLIPIALVVLFGWIGSLGNDKSSPAAEPKPSATKEIPSPTPSPTLDAAAQAKADAEKAADEAAQDAADAAKKAADEKAALDEAAAEAEAAAAAKAALGTVSQQNALRSADSYVEYKAFSRTGLIKQLKFEGFSTKDATWAVDHMTVNWNQQAAKSAAEYLDFTSFSRSSLIDQLVFEGFTLKQAKYGVSKTGL